MSKTIAERLMIDEFPFEIIDKKGRRIYWEKADRTWMLWYYDFVGNLHYFENSLGHKSKYEYDEASYKLLDGLSDADWGKDNIERYYEKRMVCNNCGCPDLKKTYDGYWCKYCHNEMSIKTTEQ